MLCIYSPRVCLVGYLGAGFGMIENYVILACFDINMGKWKWNVFHFRDWFTIVFSQLLTALVKLER